MSNRPDHLYKFGTELPEDVSNRIDDLVDKCIDDVVAVLKAMPARAANELERDVEQIAKELSAPLLVTVRAAGHVGEADGTMAALKPSTLRARRRVFLNWMREEWDFGAAEGQKSMTDELAKRPDTEGHA